METGSYGPPPPGRSEAAVRSPIDGSPMYGGDRRWIETSNRHARILIELHARFRPEAAGRYGATGLDELIGDYTPSYLDPVDAGLEMAIAELQRRLAAETDRRIVEDLRILVNTARGVRDETKLLERLMLPYVNVSRIAFDRGGVGVYAECLLFPFMPPEARLVSLQHRLMHAARAFLNPGLQDGTISIPDAYRVLREDVVLSRAMAQQEVERYTTWMPRNACAHFYGYMRLRDLRREVESALGGAFDADEYHSFLLGQGLLPLDLPRQAVMDEFVPMHCGQAAH